MNNVPIKQPDPDTGPEGSIRKREKMRSVKKETMDELARVIRKYWATGDKDILDARYRKAFELSEQAYGSDAKWLQFCDLLDGAVRFNQNVSNDIIYKIFGLLCIEVSNPERITRRPRLTEEQVQVMKALVTIGCLWLVQDHDGYTYAAVNKPTKRSEHWSTDAESFTIYVDRPSECLISLVSWSDPEPLDIVQTLREAGRLEVEG